MKTRRSSSVVEEDSKESREGVETKRSVKAVLLCATSLEERAEWAGGEE